MREAFFSGVREKVVCSHLLNESSSRSHCIFTIYVECRGSRTREVLRRSELSLVDLAGSERLSLLSRDPSATFLKESIDINTSLLALGKVITSLAEVSKKSSSSGGEGSSDARRGKVHIPYRDSKLTKLLQHALGGNSITVMIACISCSDRYVAESISTMLYTGRARNIENVPHINQDASTEKLAQLHGEIVSLKEELCYYRDLALGHLVPLSTLATSEDPLPSNKHVKREESSAVKGNQEENESCVEVEKLATSLIDACAMLQQIIGANAQLRNAYDAVIKAKEASEQREMELNAENLALRERIEMLESIALNEAFLDIKKDQEGPGATFGYDRNLGNAKGKPSDHLLDTCGAYLNPSDNVELFGGSLFDLTSPPLESKTEVDRWRSREDASKMKLESLSYDYDSKEEVEREDFEYNRRDKDINLPEGFHFKGEKVIFNQINEADALRVKSTDQYTRTQSSLEPSTATTWLENSEARRGNELLDKLLHLCPEGRQLNCDLPVNNRARKKEKRQRHVLAKRLAEYEKRYRLRTFLEPYGNSLPESSSQGLSFSPCNLCDRTASQTNFVPASTSWEGEKIAACKAIKEVKAMLRKNTPAISKAFIPKSTYCVRSYGKLDFGGEKEDVEGFEAKRQEYQATLSELLARREELQVSLQNDIYGRLSPLGKERMLSNGKGLRCVSSDSSVLLNRKAAPQPRSGAASPSPFSSVLGSRLSDRETNLTQKYFNATAHFSAYESVEPPCRLPKSTKKRPAGGVERLLNYLENDKII